VNAMLDAVVLANHLYDIKPTSFDNINTALNEYKKERFDAVMDQYSQTHFAARLQFGHVSFLLSLFWQQHYVIIMLSDT
jgi:hypothetical protein